jgi:hypothetical protein
LWNRTGTKGGYSVAMSLLQDEKKFLRRVHEIIFYASLVSAGGAIFVFLNWVAVVIAGIGAFIVLCAAYSIVARLKRLPRLCWSEYFSNFGSTSLS